VFDCRYQYIFFSARSSPAALAGLTLKDTKLWSILKSAPNESGMQNAKNDEGERIWIQREEFLEEKGISKRKMRNEWFLSFFSTFHHLHTP